MRIDDMTLTLFAWDDIPATSYGRHTGRFEGRSELGLLTLRTDEGLEGHAFLGSASRGAADDAASLMRYLKPQVMGENPLDREKLYLRLMARNRNTTWRAIGAVDIALWDIAGKAAGLPIHRLMGTVRSSAPGLCELGRAGDAGSLCRGGGLLPRRRLEGLQDSPAHRPRRGYPRLRGGAQGPSATTTGSCSTAPGPTDYPAALRVGRAAERLGFYWYEDPLADDDIANYVKLRQKLDIPILATEYSPGGFQAYAPLAAAAGDRLSARRRGR